MSNYIRHQLDKEKMKAKAATAKPEKPRYAEQANLTKTLFELDEHFDSKLRNEDAQLSDELSKKWAGNGGGSRGDAFIAGLQSGMRKGSILDDKKRMEKYKSGIEKMEGMIAHQNEELARQERLHAAKQAIMPNWMAYSQRFNVMDPANREQAIDSMIQKYNEIAGTNYRRESVDGKEPWKVTVMDEDGAQVINMMDVMKTPEEMRMQMMMNSPAYQQAEQMARSEHNMEQESRKTDMELKKEKIDVLRQESADLQNYKKVEDSIRQEKGDSVISLDRFISKPSQWNHSVKNIETGIERGNSARKVIHTAERLKQIVEKNPNIFGGFKALLSEARKDGAGVLNTLATKAFVQNKDRADFEEAAKLLVGLYTAELKTLPTGARLNQFLEQKMSGAVPSLNQIPESFGRVMDHIVEDVRHYDEQGQKFSDYYQEGFEYKPKIREYNAPAKTATKVKLPSGEQLTPDEIRARDPRMSKFSDEQIADWAKAKKGAQ